jgi:murein endopeptidase
MERRILYFIFLFLLGACGKSPGFKATDFDYTRVQSVAPKDKIDSQIKGEAPVHNSIVRFANKIEFKPVDSKWSQNQVTLKVAVKVGDQSYGPVDFTGVRKDSGISLLTNHEDLADKLRARLICLSEGESCDEFFIDVVYRDSEVFLHDQIKSSSRETQTTANSTTTTLGANTTTTIRAVVPTTTTTTTTTTLRRSKTTSSTTTTTVRELRFPPTPPPVGSGTQLEIQDGEPEVDTSEAAYVGISDEEIKELFRTAQTPDPASAKRKGPSDSKGQAPVKEAPAQSVKSPVIQNPRTEDDSKKQAVTFESFRIRDQVIGSPSRGRIDRATDFFKLSQLPGMFFFIPHPSHKDYFGSFDLAILVKKMGEALQEMMPGRRLAVTSISKWGGGYLPPHRGHQNGTDIDFRYLTDDETKPSDVVNFGRVSSNLLISHQWKLFKKSFETNMVELVFVDLAVKKALCDEARRLNEYKTGETDSPAAEVLKRIQPWAGHDNHFHVRARCSSDNPRCRRTQMVFAGVGC